jgi:N-carbamoyl-L-amino-acid hydrolase
MVVNRARMQPGAAMLELLQRFAVFGATPKGGVTRLCGSSEDKQARDLFAAELAAAGAQTRTDAVGNQFGIFPLTDAEDAPLVMMGSHLDSQPCAGKLDGALGVAAALSTGAALLEAKRQGAKFNANFCAVNWTNEEGARFRPSLLGSGTFAGAFAADYALARRDDAGVSLGDALDTIGYRGTDAPPQPACYLELHIEQGSVLEDEGARIGIVTRNWGAVKLDVVFTGEQAHTGPTPMERRKDALLAAAYAIADIRAIAAHWPGQVHSSVGRMIISPNSANVVPARVELSVEVRSADDEVLAKASEMAVAAIAAAGPRAAVTAEIAGRSNRLARGLPPEVSELVALCAAEAGHKSRLMDTVAGHDALSLLGLCPMGLIFVPSIGGITHNEAEATAEEDLLAGLDVCLRAVRRLCLAGGAPDAAAGILEAVAP